MSQPAETGRQGVGPDSPPTTRATLREQRHGRAGRNLPAATAVGLGLGVVVVAGLFIRKEVFLAVLAVVIGLAVWELTQALRRFPHGMAVPLAPVLVGSVAMLVAGYSAGGQALTVCFVLTAVGVVVWRTSEGPAGALRDVTGGIFTAAYLPLLAGFVALMLAEEDGSWRVFTFVVLTVCSDVGGYTAGVLFGRHPMAPSVSPKKSWEGFAGSATTCVVGGLVCLPLVLGGPWWGGPVLGLAVAVGATVGDLAESMIKRDLGVKDMGSTLPGHGGVLDRIDSLVVTAPVVWLLLRVLG